MFNGQTFENCGEESNTFHFAKLLEFIFKLCCVFLVLAWTGRLKSSTGRLQSCFWSCKWQALWPFIVKITPDCVFGAFFGLSMDGRFNFFDGQLSWNSPTKRLCVSVFLVLAWTGTQISSTGNSRKIPMEITVRCWKLVQRAVDGQTVRARPPVGKKNVT